MNNNLRELWIKKSNSLEELYLKNKNKFYLIDNSIDYYMSMLELAIYYIKDYDNTGIKEKYFSRYLKELFFNSNYKNINIEKLIVNKNNNYNYNLVIARLFYADYYFDLIEDIINNRIDQEKLYCIIDRVDEYWDYVNYIISIVEKIYPIKKVSFRY